MKAPAIMLGVAAVASAAILLWPRADPTDLTPQPANRPTMSPGPAPVAGAPASPALQAIAFAPQGAAGAPAAAPPPAPVQPPALVGVTLRPRPIAYVTMAGRAWRAGLGDEVGGWRVAAIGEKSVRLRRGGRTLALSLYGPRPAPPPPPRQPATPVEAQSAASVPNTTAASVHAHMPPAPADAPRYWVGPPGSAPPGYTPLPASALPPPMRR
jgi:hypothetical protein